MTDDEVMEAYHGSGRKNASELRPCYPVIYSAHNKSVLRVVRQGSCANSHHPLIMVGAGCITSDAPGRPYNACKYGKISETHWDLLKSENRTLKMKIREGLTQHDEKIIRDLLEIGEGLHYAFWVKAEDLVLVYTSTSHRDRGREQIIQSGTAKRNIVDKSIQNWSGPSVRSYMTWEVSRKIAGKAEELQKVLNNHFRGTGYSSRYTHSEIEIETLEDVIAITFHSVPPWLGDKITIGGYDHEISARPCLYSAQPQDGPLNERGLGYRFLGTGTNVSSSGSSRAGK